MQKSQYGLLKEESYHGSQTRRRTLSSGQALPSGTHSALSGSRRNSSRVVGFRLAVHVLPGQLGVRFTSGPSGAGLVGEASAAIVAITGAERQPASSPLAAATLTAEMSAPKEAGKSKRRGGPKGTAAGAGDVRDVGFRRRRGQSERKWAKMHPPSGRVNKPPQTSAGRQGATPRPTAEAVAVR